MSEEQKQKISEGWVRRREEQKAKLAEAKALAERQDSPEKRMTALEDKVNKVLDVVDRLTSLIPKPATIVLPTPPVPSVTASSFSTPFPTKLEDMIPENWLKELQKTLGEEFSFKVMDSNGDFVLQMIVPAEYDRRQGLEPKMRKACPDVSTGLIHRVSDMDDVRIWANLWKQNLLKESSAYRAKREPINR